jgi:vitamin-K-epoxide reductase (warfarin-sensitive)
MIVSVMLIAAIGLCISLYGFFVESKISEDPTYHPVCDLSDRVSCSKTFLSPYGNILKFSNTVLGALFYATMILLAWLGYTQLVWYGALAAVLASVAFAYILFFKIQTICLICISIYIVNIALLIAAYTNR